jgi:hypothetical protein
MDKKVKQTKLPRGFKNDLSAKFCNGIITLFEKLFFIKQRENISISIS